MLSKHKTPIAVIFLAVLLAAGMFAAGPASASEPFLGQIKMFGFNFAPRGWALCDGQLLPINQNQSLYSLLGTTYGGDGRTSFALPDLRGRIPIHPGQAAGSTTDIRQGQRGGAEAVVLDASQIPAHSHGVSVAVRAASGQGTGEGPAGDVAAFDSRENQYSDAAPDVSMAASTVTVALAANAGGQAHGNMPPFQVVSYGIALQGVFPSRN